MGTISLQNIWQTRVVTPKGEMRGADQDPSGVINSLLPQASWKIDPATVPDALKSAWRAVEFGDFQTAAPYIRRYVNSRDEETKAAAAKLNSIIESQMNAQFAAAQEAEKAGRKWEAYKAYDALAMRFRGFDKGREASAAARKLSTDKSIADEVKALRYFQQAQDLAGAKNPGQRRQAKQMLEAIAEKFAATEGASMAKALLETMKDD